MHCLLCSKNEVLRGLNGNIIKTKYVFLSNLLSVIVVDLFGNIIVVNYYSNNDLLRCSLDFC